MKKICLNVVDLKDMLNKTKEKYGERVAYKIKLEPGKYKTITHREARDMIDSLGTALIDLGLKNKRIAVIGENRYEWEIAYLSIVCGTGTVVPLDKSLPEVELESLIERSEIEAIFCTNKSIEMIKKIKQIKSNNLKYIISMDYEKKDGDIYSQKELIEKGKELIEAGNADFINAKINPDEMNIMLFTSGTTSKSKVVALSHKNLCSNLMDASMVLEVNEDDMFLSILPIHHVYECTVGFLFSLYRGAQTVFGDGIRHLVENLNEYKPTVVACVPGIYEIICSMLEKELGKQGNVEEIYKNEKYKNMTLKERKKEFQNIHNLLGGNLNILLSGAAALDPVVEEKYRLLGFNLVQGYGLTEASPIVSVVTEAAYKLGSVGRPLPNVQAKIENENSEGIGELVLKGPNIMLGYYGDEETTKNSLKNGWFYTGDLARIDEDGFIFICGRKKSVIVLKNGKNVFPEELETLINKIGGVKESFVYGKQKTEDKENVRIKAKIIFDRAFIKEKYNVDKDEEIQKIFNQKIKELNEKLPKYKAIRGVIISETPLIKTTTNKIKRQENLDEIKKSEN